MKRLWICVLTVVLLSAFIGGCGNTAEPTLTAKPSPAKPTAAPTAAPTQAAATPRPTDVPTQAPTVAVTEPPVLVDTAWFNDAVFIGDSVTVALDQACAAEPALLGSAKFLCAQDLGYHSALLELNARGAAHPTYEGKTVLAENAAQITGCSKVFILLGLNDIGTYGVEDTLEKAKELARRILRRSPNASIYFQSATPMLNAKESNRLNNDKIARFDAMLQAYCNEAGVHFVDIYHYVCDEKGDLKKAYCSDPDAQGIHLNAAGCAAWVTALKSSVAAPYGDNEPDVIAFRVKPTDPEATEQPVTQPEETVGED